VNLMPTRRTHKQRTHLGASHFMTLPLYASDGKTPLSPTVALDMALQDGPIEERHLMLLAQEYDDPNVVAHTLERLGAIRVRQDDGTVVVTLPDEKQGFRFATEPGTDTEGYPSPRPSPAGGGSGKIVTSEGTASLSLNFADNRSSALDDYERTGNTGAKVPWREATRAGVKMGEMTIVRDADGKPFVYASDLEAFKGKSQRANPVGAGQKIADKVNEAVTQRSSAHEAAVRARKASQESRRIAIANAKPSPGSTAH
jgi:hypothetical protein